MVCNVLLITALSFLRDAEQKKGRKSAEGFMFLIFLSQHNAECSAVFTVLRIPKSVANQEFIKSEIY